MTDRIITPSIMKEIRQHNGLSLREMGVLLGLNGEYSADKVRGFENGSREPTGPIKVLYSLLEWDMDTGGLPDFLFPFDDGDEEKVDSS